MVHDERRIVAGAVFRTKACCAIAGAAKSDSRLVKSVYRRVIRGYEGQMKAFVHADGA